MWVASGSAATWELTGANGLGCPGLTIWVDLPSFVHVKQYQPHTDFAMLQERRPRGNRLIGESISGLFTLFTMH